MSFEVLPHTTPRRCAVRSLPVRGGNRVCHVTSAVCKHESTAHQILFNGAGSCLDDVASVTNT
jgi:hypothetical protein